MNTHSANAAIPERIRDILANQLLPETDLVPASEAARGNLETFGQLLIQRGSLTSYQWTAIAEGRAAALRVGNYDLLDHLGAGGMGTVYKARHRRMKRIVAIKVLATELSQNEKFVQRFQREVETIACLGHPNVVMAYDADQCELGHFLVMEFVNGVDLAAYVDRHGPLSTAQAVDCLRQAACGLAYAHGQNIVHRDIKPHNLLRDQKGTIKVTDMGLARLTQETDSPSRTDLTMAGDAVMGTVDYMPPEQAFDPQAVDQRADIYSLGCTLHFLLSGRPPYAGRTLMSVLVKHRDAEIPPLADLRSDVPPRLERLFQQMLAKRPEDRIATMDEVAAQLNMIVAERGPDAAVAWGEANGPIVEFPSIPPAPTIIASAQYSSVTLPLPMSRGAIEILVVEPSRVQTSIIKQYASQHQYVVLDAVGTGAAAIEAVRRQKPHVVISAMHLPDVDGVQLAKQIRAEFASQPPGFVLVTSAAEHENGAAGLSQLDRVWLLPKPFDSSDLAKAVQFVAGTSPAAPSPTRMSIDPAEFDRQGDRGQVRVLLVDDSATARLHQRTVLQSLRFCQFTEVSDGAQAIAVAATEAFGLIVTDYNMPLMDGRALVSYLKQNPSTAKVPIIMVTTESDARRLDAVRQMGVVAILDKTFATHEVAPLVDRLF